MYRFKIGDKVKVFAGRSESSKKLSGKIGIITKINTNLGKGYCCLDIEANLSTIFGGGIWLDEIKLIEKSFEHIKPYGIVNFLKGKI